jgi:hypothetical protein
VVPWRYYDCPADTVVDKFTSNNEYSRNYFDARDYLHSSTDYFHSTRNYLHSARHYFHSSRNYFHSPRNYFHSSRNYLDSSRDYFHSSRDYFNPSRDYPHSSGNYLDSSGDYLHSARDYIYSARDYLHSTRNFHSSHDLDAHRYLVSTRPLLHHLDVNDDQHYNLHASAASNYHYSHSNAVPSEHLPTNADYNHYNYMGSFGSLSHDFDIRCGTLDC